MLSILLTGATGFVGGALLRALIGRGMRPRCLVRDPQKLVRRVPEAAGRIEVVKGDLADRGCVEQALEGIEVAYYLVHSMGGRSLVEAREFARRDRQAARSFVAGAGRVGLRRVIYLGGLGETARLSEHLASRREVGEVLGSGRAEATILRAPVIIGAGSASFEIIRHLVERLPVMAAPRWVDTRCQPIYIDDVVRYLVGSALEPRTAGRTLGVCGPEVLTYRDMMLEYARVRGLHRVVLGLPGLGARLSAYWVDLLTPVSPGLTHPLIEGLATEVVCGEAEIRELIPFRLTPYREAVCRALSEETTGPGAGCRECRLH